MIVRDPAHPLFGRTFRVIRSVHRGGDLPISYEVEHRAGASLLIPVAYARALVKHLGEPGLELQRLFRKVREDVMAETGGQQRPYEYGSLIGPDLFFRPAMMASAKLPETSPPVIAPPQPNAATAEWGRVDKASIAEVETFERRHPSSPKALSDCLFAAKPVTNQ